MAVKPAFATKTSSQDPDTAKSVYVADVPFATKRAARPVALARLDGRLVASTAIALKVAAGGGPPRPGEKAIKIDTPTEAEVGDVSKIDTRVPPDTMHDVNFADVLGRKPSCWCSPRRRCARAACAGRSSTMAEQLKSQYGDKAAFIHMEIYNDNDLAKGVPPAGPRVEAAERAVDVHDRSSGQRGGVVRGRGVGRRAPARDREGDSGVALA